MTAQFNVIVENIAENKNKKGEHIGINGGGSFTYHKYTGL